MCSGLQGVLGVFQKLVASRAHDAEGFRILDALLQHLPLAALQPYLPTVRVQHPWNLRWGACGVLVGRGLSADIACS